VSESRKSETNWMKSIKVRRLCGGRRERSAELCR
jgi:hypothetical protein